MEFKKALQLVLELAESAILGKDECDSKELFEEQEKQQEAILLVEEYWDGLSDD